MSQRARMLAQVALVAMIIVVIILLTTPRAEAASINTGGLLNDNNWSIENTGKDENWTLTSTAADAIIATTYAKFGTQSWKFPTETLTEADRVGTSARVPAMPGVSYTASIWGLCSSATFTDVFFKAGIAWYDSTDTLLENAASAPTGFAAGTTWYQATYTYTAPATAAYARLRFVIFRSGATSRVVYIDGARLTETFKPHYTSLTPDNNATGVAVNQNVVVVFNESENTGATVTLVQTGGTAVTYTGPTWSKTNYENDTATWTHTNWANGETFTLKVSGYEDLSGNTAPDNTWTITTTVNAAPNTPTLVSPANNTWTNSRVFSATVTDPDGGNVTAKFVIGGTTYSGSTVASGSDSTYTHTADLNGVTWYAYAEDPLGATSANTATWTAKIDTSTPEIVAADAGASSSDRVSLISDNWFSYAATGSDDKISISWTDPASASDDVFYYQRNATATAMIDGDENVTTNAYVDDDNAISEGTWYYHVRPRTGASTWGTERIFIIKYDKSAPAAPACSSPTNGAVNQATSVTLSVAPPTDSVSGLHVTAPYWFRVATDSGFSAGVQDSPWTTNGWNPSLSQGVTYYWKAKARDNVANESDYGSSFSFITAVGQAVSINSATDGTNTIYACNGTENLQDANVTVSIGLSQPASSMTLYYDDDVYPWDGTSATDPDLSAPWIVTILASDANVYNGATVYFAVDVGGTKYYLTGITPWSYIVDGAAPTGAVCSTPADNAIGVSTTTALTENRATDGTGSGLHATPYYLQLATNTAFTQNLQESGWRAENSWSPTLAVATTYYWRVKARDKVGNVSAWRGHTATASYGTFTTRGMTLTLTTDKDNYQQGQTIQISGTAKDPRGTSISTGTATIRLSCGTWSDNKTTTITNGSYSYNYQTTFSNPTGAWTITVTAVDAYNNTGENTKSVTIYEPPKERTYTIQFLSPTVGVSYKRGSTVSISVKVTDWRNENVGGAQVSFTTPTGEKRSLAEMTAGTGTYAGSYKVGWTDSVGNWVLSVDAKKTVENLPYDGWKSMDVGIESSAAMQVTLKDFPARVEAGQTVEIKAQALYPDGSPVEDATISVITPSGENVTLVYVGNGIYSAPYTITAQDVGSWGVKLSATDLYGNAGESPVSTVEVASMGAGRLITTYWWAFLAVFAAIGTASAYVAWRTILTQRLRKVRKEMKEIPKLKKETMLKYFKEGSIERDTYDEMMDKHDMRMEELRKQEMLLSARVEKKRRARRARKKR